MLNCLAWLSLTFFNIKLIDMEFKSINPYNDEVLQSFARQTKEEVENILEKVMKEKEQSKKFMMKSKHN